MSMLDPYRTPDVDALLKQLNPNQIAPGNATGLGSGNPVQETRGVAPSFFINGNTNNFTGPDQIGDDDATGTNGGIIDDDPTTTGDETPTSTPGQDPLEVLTSFFPDVDISELEGLTQFVSVIPSEIYEAADPESEMYSLMRQERTGMLEEQRSQAEQGLRGSLFQSLEQARGMEGNRGFALGRNVYGNISNQAAMRFEGIQSNFSRGLYNISEDIINRITGAQRYLAGLEANQRSDMLRLADLADLFDYDPTNNEDNDNEQDQDDYEDG